MCNNHAIDGNNIGHPKLSLEAKMHGSRKGNIIYFDRIWPSETLTEASFLLYDIFGVSVGAQTKLQINFL